MGRFLILLLTLSAFAPPALSETAAEQLHAIQNLGLDPQQCFRVRDVFLEREDVKLYFVDGYLIFAEPLKGRMSAALFVAHEPTDQGEVLLIPPNARERQSLVRFTSEPALHQRFRTAMMFFTDDSAAVLRASIEESAGSRLDTKAGADLARKWSYPVHNVLEGLSLRMLFDTFSNLPLKNGFFAAAIGGGPAGRFDVVVDPRNNDQVTMGQTVWRDGQRFYEVWSKFSGRRFRSGQRKPVPHRGHLENYRIEARLGADLEMQVSASADFFAEGSTQRIVAFELSKRLRLQKVLIDDIEAEFIQFSEPNSSSAAVRHNDLIAIVLPGPAESEARRRIEFHYAGKVVSDAGNGVYYVGSRGSWYPRRDNPFTHFELVFHYPDQLDLVATGDLVDSSTSDGVRTSIFRTASPIKLAGFNLGTYARAHHDIGDYRVEVCANKEVEENLRPRTRPPIIWSPIPAGSRGSSRRRSQDALPTIITPTPLDGMPSLVSRLEYVASDSAEAFSFFLDRFGPPASSKIVISPIPGSIGQGFPGLVYASTLSYFRPSDPPLARRSPDEQLFYSELLRSHEISHQWWGNVVAPEGEQDKWLMEALATYSSLLLLEKRHGRTAVDRVLATFKTNLLARGADGETIENTGAIVLGDRLRSSRAPEAMRIIVYEKGAWIMHMLRGVMGDSNFFAFLRSLCEKYRFRSIDSEGFRTLAAKFLPQDSPDRDLQDFFDQWVYSSGIPTLKVDFETKSAGREFLVTGRLRQDDIPDSSSLIVALQAQSAEGPGEEHLVFTEGKITEFEFTTPRKPTEIRIDPRRFILMNQ